MKVSIRRDRETGRPILFFYNSNPRKVWLECYDRIGQHSEACPTYMRECAPIDPDSLEAQELRDEWDRIPGGTGFPSEIVRRLTP